MLLDISLNIKKNKPSLHTSSRQVYERCQDKSEIFNAFFAKQCSLLKTESRILPQLLPHTNTWLNTIRFSDNEILKVI